MIRIRETTEKFNTPLFNGKVILSEKMSLHTTFKIGGTAPLYIEPSDKNSLLFAIKTLCENNIPYFVLGGGSNIVVSDKGFDCAVISMNELRSIEIDNETVFCQAGTPTSYAVSVCAENSLSALETFAGLPGSIGGAIFMNARCFDVSISDVLYSVEYLDCATFEIKTYLVNSNDWSYKVSPFQKMNCIIISATFKTVKVNDCDKENLLEKCKHFINEREAKGHFKFPSAGSVFKNNRAFGKPSGILVDEAGLKGFRIGGAQVAPWHGNFIINIDNASAKDVEKLVEHIIKVVQEKYGFTLECEIIFCGIK